MRVGESEGSRSRGRSVRSSEEFKAKGAHVGTRTVTIEETGAMPQTTLETGNGGRVDWEFGLRPEEGMT